MKTHLFLFVCFLKYVLFLQRRTTSMDHFPPLPAKFCPIKKPLRPANPRTFAKRSVSTVKVGAGAGAGADDVSEIIEVITKTVARTIKAVIFILKVVSGSTFATSTPH